MHLEMHLVPMAQAASRGAVEIPELLNMVLSSHSWHSVLHLGPVAQDASRGAVEDWFLLDIEAQAAVIG